MPPSITITRKAIGNISFGKNEIKSWIYYFLISFVEVKETQSIKLFNSKVSAKVLTILNNCNKPTFNEKNTQMEKGLKMYEINRTNYRAEKVMHEREFEAIFFLSVWNSRSDIFSVWF